ncbi:pseudouridine synthase [Acholeplasma equirhinis]|uniref:pseudouridine synthase n=1 Tax=Acholeplasma equirhinis TaxID=555393 RepID=UPI001F08BCBC|nr:pseudouridine synthase [Acholeplasma equirhinis]
MDKAKQYKKTEYTTREHLLYDAKEMIRLNKYISECGVASRREADRMIEVGRIKVNGIKAVVGMQIKSTDEVTLDGKLITLKTEKIYIALNKPEGIVSTTDTAIKDNMITFMNYKEKIFPIGRLDKETSGLILLTNDGDIVNKILRVENGHEKEYIVEVDKKISNEFIDTMQSGVTIYNPVSHKNQKTMPAVLKPLDDTRFHLTIKQGLNRQIRRMTEALGYKVVKLQRIRIMHIELGDLPIGYWRYLTQDEIQKLEVLM